MSRITITIDTPDTLDTKDFVFEVDDALNMGFKHEYCMWTATQKRGRWIEYETEGLEGGGITFCSCCGTGCTWGAFREVNRFNYCPNCGARMENEI